MLQPNASSAAAVSARRSVAQRGLTLLTPAPEVRLVRGRDAILRVQPVLQQLAYRCGQAGEVDSLFYFLSTADARKKRPCLVMFGADTAPTGAVLLFEYMTPLGVGTRVYAATDGSGRRNVLAAAGTRARVAALAAKELIDRGAHFVQVNFNEAHLDIARADAAAAARGTVPPDPYGSREKALAAVLQVGEATGRDAVWALHEREIPMYLPLLSSFDETLARISQKTRANLRYYRRRCEADLGCTFVAEATIDLKAFLDFSRVMFWPVSEAVARARFKMLGSTAADFLCGIKDRDGAWLSLVRGRRQAGIIEIDWLMNRADLPAYSLSTVVRSYLIEHAIGQGAQRLYIEGGTAMPMRSSFLRQQVSELTVKRSSAYVRVLERLATRINHYLASTLVSTELLWRPVRRLDAAKMPDAR